MAADKLLARGNMKSAIRSPNLTDLAIWPLLIDTTAIAAIGLVLDLDKTAIVALIKRPLRLAGLDKIAIRFASLPKNCSAWPLINSFYGTI